MPGTSDAWTWSLLAQMLCDWVKRGKPSLNKEQMYEVYLISNYLVIETLSINDNNIYMLVTSSLEIPLSEKHQL